MPARYLALVAFGALLLAAASGCSDRVETPTMTPDSTLVYVGKNGADVMATITFANKDKTSRRSGQRLGVTRSFDLEESGKVYGFVDLTNRLARGEMPLDFHLVWLKPGGKTAYKKRMEYVPSDEETTLTGTFSYSAKRRKPGEYTLRVYLFRELIAEKTFQLIGEGAEEPGEEDEHAGD